MSVLYVGAISFVVGFAFGWAPSAYRAWRWRRTVRDVTEKFTRWLASAPQRPAEPASAPAVKEAAAPSSPGEWLPLPQAPPSGTSLFVPAPVSNARLPCGCVPHDPLCPALAPPLLPCGCTVPVDTTCEHGNVWPRWLSRGSDNAEPAPPPPGPPPPSMGAKVIGPGGVFWRWDGERWLDGDVR